MIWFACKNCGKTHSRAETSVGTMVFCDCGQGTTVPWESTVEPPPVLDALPEPARAAPAPPLPAPYNPVPVGEERVPPKPRPPEAPRPAERLPTRAGRDRRPGPRRRDPRFCLNHEDAPSHKTCVDCRDAFCADCLVEFGGVTLCGPCKNFRVRTRQRPPRVSGKAIASVVIALLAWPLSFILAPLALSADAPALVLLALPAHLTALGLGLGALRDAEANPRVGGRSLAVTGALTGAVASVLTLFLAIFPPPALL